MLPSVAQSPPLELTLSDSDTVGPPPSATVRSLVPWTRKPSWLPSGEKKGDPAPAVPGTGVAWS